MIFLIQNNDKTKRVALLIEYKGKGLVGWQKQNNGTSVQEEIEKAIKILYKTDCHLQAAGRTDAGVNAFGQVAHTDVPLNNEFSVKNNFYLVYALNSLLRKTNIRIISIQNTSNEFNARFSAIKRSYVYKFLCRSAPPSILNDQVWHIQKKINIDSMKLAANHLIGNHDFSSFRSSSCQASSPVKTINKFQFDFSNDVLEMRVEAKSFLHNQVRIIAGSLIKVGTGIWDGNKIKEILKLRSRKEAGETAPPGGLYLEKVTYPKNILNSKWPTYIND